MAIQQQQVGVSGTISEVKAGSVLPVAGDNAQVVIHRPDDPILTALVADTFITGQGGQTALGNNILLAVAGTSGNDCTNFRAIALQIVPAAGTVTAGAVTFEGSNDGANWIAMPLYDKAAPYAIPLTTYSIVAATPRYFIGNILYHYFRVRISTGVTGTTTGLQAFSELMGTDVTFINQMVRHSDGTNLTPAMDAAGRRGYQQLTDGTTSVVVTAASTSAAAANPGLVVSLSPNLPAPSLYTLESAASTNAASIKASAGRLLNIALTSPLVTATVRFIKLYNKASAPTVGTDIPVMTIPFPTVATNGGSVVIEFGTLGMYFTTGIALAITGLSTTADTTAVAAGDVKVMANYI